MLADRAPRGGARRAPRGARAQRRRQDDAAATARRARDPRRAGTVEIDGIPATEGGYELRRRIGYATQRRGLLSTSVRRNVELPAALARHRHEASAGARRWLRSSALGVAHLAERRAARALGRRGAAREPGAGARDRARPAPARRARRRRLTPRRATLPRRRRARAGRPQRHRRARVPPGGRGAPARRPRGDPRRRRGPPARHSAVGRPATCRRDRRQARRLRQCHPRRKRSGRTGTHRRRRCGLPAHHPSRPATLATWGTAIRIAAPGRGPLEARVERVSPGPGRWEVVLAVGETLRAHLPFDDVPPQAGELVSVTIDAAHATVIYGPSAR